MEKAKELEKFIYDTLGVYCDYCNVRTHSGKAFITFEGYFGLEDLKLIVKKCEELEIE